MKRSGKFYRKNEAEVMRTLGLEPTKNSGSGWVEKEDGQSDELICQLKSTDADSIRIQRKDLDILKYNAAVAHKLPIFAIQFLKDGEVYLLVKPEMLCEVAEYIKTGEYTNMNDFLDIDLTGHEDVTRINNKRVIKSSSKARDKFIREREDKYKRKEKSAI